MVALRDYQKRCVTLAYQSLRKNNRTILQLPTGAGKTHIAAAIIQQGVEKGRNILFVVDRLTLLAQTQQAFYDLGVYASCLQGDNSTWRHGDKVVVCSAQTLERRDFWPDAHLVIIDECHDQRKAIYDQMDKWDGIKWLGLTATPYTTGLGLKWDDLVIGSTPAELIDMGYLSTFEAWGCPPDVRGVSTVAGDYNQKELGEKVNTVELTGKISQHYLQHAADRQGLIFAVDIAHSEAITEQMNAAGIHTEHIDCYSDSDEKYETIDAFRKSNIQCLSSVGILSKGFDVPQVGAIVLARPTKSLSLHLQQCGRGLRIAEDKDKCIILDHAGNCQRFGLPDEDFSRELCTKKRGVSGADKEKDEPKPKECPSCTFMKPAGVHVCPEGGVAPKVQSKIKETDTVLVRLAGDKDKKTKQSVYSQLLWVADNRRYSEGWAAHKYREIFGVWPAKLSKIRKIAAPGLSSWIKSRQIAWAKRKKA